MLRLRKVSAGFTIEHLGSLSFSLTEVMHSSKSLGLPITMGALFIWREREKERHPDKILESYYMTVEGVWALLLILPLLAMLLLFYNLLPIYCA